MISYFENGLKQKFSSNSLTFDELVELIKFSKNKDIIQKIRILKKNQDSSYKKLKEKMPIVTPNCEISIRKLNGNNFDANFIGFSNYLYFDFDNIRNGNKEHFIEKYSDQVALVSKSIGGDGLSVLVKIDYELNSTNFNDVWVYVRNNVFGDENVDTKCCDIGRAWFISSDEEVYINKSSHITVNPELLENFRNNAKQGKVKNKNISNIYSNNDNNKLFNHILYTTSITDDIKAVKNKLIFESVVHVENNVIDFKQVKVCKVFVPNVIPDGKKREIYRVLIHKLVYLNPYADANTIFSYLTYINRHNAKPSMDYFELRRYFAFIFSTIKTNGIVEPILDVKRIHFNEKINYTKAQKVKIANRINGLYRRKEKYDRIMNVIEKIKSMNKKVTKKEISDLTGIKLRTVQLLIKNGPVDFENELLKINSMINY